MNAPSHLQPHARLQQLCLRGWLVWCAFVIYGSLLPFQYRDVTWAEAVQRFSQMPWLDLGLASRIDWLANLLLYIPVGWLGMLALTVPRPTGARPLVRAAGVALCGAGLAVALEFAQVFFAPRTVSLNDLVAELAGTVLGVVGALSFGPGVLVLVQRALSTAAGARTAWLFLYLLAYAALTLFPFDFTSPGEVLRLKLDRGHAGWVWAPVNWARPVPALAKLAAEVLLVLPFGMALARSRLRLHVLSAALLGALAGVLIEVVQLFLLSATSQGLSVLSRACGLALGAAAAPHLPRLIHWSTPSRRRVIVGLGAPVWLVMAAVLAGWGQHAPVVTGWLDRASQIQLLPFYYHYYSGEAGALTSVLLCVAVYLWVGVGAALVAPRARAWLPAVVAMAVAAALESSQLLLAGRKPDPTNVWLAGAVAWLAFRLSTHLFKGPVDGAIRATVDPRPSRPAPSPGTAQSPHQAGTGWIGLLTAAAVVLAVQAFAGHPLGLVLAIAVFTAGLWTRPAILPMVLPAVLLLTDVDSHTGLRAFDAVDGFMLAALVVAARGRARQPVSGPVGASRLPPALFTLAAFVPATVIGLQGSGVVDWTALLSPLDAARTLWLAKGVLWAAVGAVAIWRLGVGLASTCRLVARGMTIALGGVVALTLYERLAFVSLLDFATSYRAPGPFSAIALGGAYIEAFLAAATPFAVVCALRERSPLVRWACMALVLAAAYATMITYSRGGQVVFLAVVVLTAAWASWRRLTPAAVATGRPALLMVAAVSGLSAAVLVAPFASARFNTLGSDAQSRFSHWSQGLGLSGSGLSPLLLGNGLGRFGRDAYVQGVGGPRPGAFTWHREGDQAWLTAHAGSLSYLDQRVKVTHGETLTLTARVRSTGPERLDVTLCEKDLVQSVQCGVAPVKSSGGGWHTVTAPLVLAPHPNLGWPPRPVRLSLFKGDGQSMDIAGLSLKDSRGRELLANGDFSEGTAHWLYSSDMHLVWHLKNLWLQVFYECGVVGTLAMAWLLVAGAWGAWRTASAGQPEGFALLMALLAVHGVGLIDTVIDTQRFLAMYLWLCLIACALGTWSVASPRRARL